jgi:FkbM family methyltransferase
VGLLKTLRRRIERIGLPRAIQIRRPTEFHGSRKGGWAACPSALDAASTVYSFGVGKEISFELSLIRRYGLRLYAFDPTPAVSDWLRARELPPQFQYLPTGLADYDGEAAFSPNTRPREVSHTLLTRPETAARAVRLPVRRLATLAAALGHARIDLLKLDVEGAEYAALQDLLAAGPPVAQILVEFHHRFPGVGRRATVGAIRMLNRHGYRIFHISASGREYGFVQSPACSCSSSSSSSVVVRRTTEDEDEDEHEHD